jgi:hypothetical protein
MRGVLFKSSHITVSWTSFRKSNSSFRNGDAMRRTKQKILRNSLAIYQKTIKLGHNRTMRRRTGLGATIKAT